MKETYTRKEIEAMLKEAEEILEERYQKSRNTDESGKNFDKLLGCEFTMGVFKACMDLYEKGWKE